MSKIDYNGKTLSIDAIAKLEGIKADSLRNRYKETQDIYEAVKLTKEAKEKRSQIPYNGQILSINAIAKLEGINEGTLRNKYKENNDINEAIKLAKEAQAKINQIPYNGQILSINAIAKLEEISQKTLQDKYNKTKDINEAVKLTKEAKEKRSQISYNGKLLTVAEIAKLEEINGGTLRNKYKENNDINEAIKLAKEAQAKINQIPYNGQILSIFAIAKLEGVSPNALGKRYSEIQDVYEAVRLTKEAQEKGRISQIPYNGQMLSISAIARLEGVCKTTLTIRYQKNQDINKSVMLCKLIKSRNERKKEIIQTKEFGDLTHYDLSLILGIKYSKLEELLEQGNSIDDIISSKECITKKYTSRETIKLENGQLLNEYCIENKLNYVCIYRAMKVYGKTLEEAVASYNKNGQTTPKKWIFEKYGLLLKHLLLKESVDINKVVSYMREDYLPLEQAIERYIIRKNAQKEDLDKDWMEELYDVLSDDSLGEEEYEGYVQTFYVDEKEEDCIKKSKEKFNNVKRKLLLFELSEVLEEGLFSPEEEKRLFEEYNITENEVDIIFKDLYKRFTSPGVLMGKDQEEEVTPEIEQKREEQISKYKQMVRNINQDNNIVVMMRFMVGNNVKTNEECRNELHKELDKEEMKKVDIGSES